MNKIHRVVWNESTCTWVAVSETARAHGKSKSTINSEQGAVVTAALWLAKPLALALALASYGYAAPPAATQLPTGGQLVAGQASIQQNATSLNITQTTNQAAINWQTFNIGSQASVNFIQPSSSSVILNRVLDPNPSQIFGHINANGQVFITNPNGVYFSPTSSVDVGSLTATTHSISNADFMAGNYHFTRDGATGAVVNEGELKSGINGYVALLAPEVRNSGVIVAKMGTVALAAGEGFDLQLDGNNTLASLHVTPSTIQALVENKSAVLAPGGLIILSAQAVDHLQGGVINNSGSLSASSLVSKGGRILLEGDAITLKSGSSLAASGVSDGTAGAVGGGTVLVGGDWQGSGTMHQASTVTMEAGANIDASATQLGDGGKVVLWSDISNANSQTTANGSIMTRGGVKGGNGGQVETSGHNVNIGGIRVNAGADKGTGGLWLIDPANSTIDQTVANSYQSTLNGGTDVFNDVTGNIIWNSGVTLHKTAGGAATLTLRTRNSGGTDYISINNATIDSTAPSGPLNLVLWTRYDGAWGNDSRIGIYTSTINTNGGNLWMGGGDGTTGSPWNGLAVGGGPAQAAAQNQAGVLVSGSSISTGAGNIFMSGISNVSATNTGTRNFGIQVNKGSSINTTSGQIDMSAALAGTYVNGVGLLLGNFDTDAGNVTVSSTTGAINLIAAAGGGGGAGWAHGILLHSNTASDITTVRSDSGIITLNGSASTTASTDTSGLQFQVSSGAGSVQVVSKTGNINLLGSNNLESSQYQNAIRFAAADRANNIRIGYDGTNAYSGNILIQGNSLLQRTNQTGTGSIGVQSTGNLTIQSAAGASFTQLRAGDTGTLSFDDDWNFGTTLGSFTLGKSSNTSDVTLSNALSVNGPISIYGGNVNTNANLTATASGAEILLKGTGNITQAASTSVTSNGGKIVYWADSDNSGQGYISLAAGDALSSGGGKIVLGGGLDDGGSNAGLSGLTASDGIPDGYAKTTDVAGSASVSAAGVSLGPASGTGNSVNLVSGGGDIIVRGQGNSSNNGVGITSQGTFKIDSGVGTVTLLGKSNGGHGIELCYGAAPSWAINSASTSPGAIDIEGTTAAAGYVGTWLGNVSSGNILIQATGSGGGVTLKGTATTGTGLYLTSGAATTQILAQSGAINLTGYTSSGNNDFTSNGALYLGNLGNASVVNGVTPTVTNSSSNITLSSDVLAFGATANVNTTGTLTVQPYGNDFSSALSWPLTNLTLGSSVSGLTIGKSATSADGTSDVVVTIGSATSIAGPINIYGSSIAINSGATLASTAGIQGILLKSSGSITDAANLTTSGGDITLWANSTGAAAGGIQLNNGVTLSSSGGAITLGGSASVAFMPATSANGTVLPQGYAANNAAAGISLGTTIANTTTMNSSGGDVNIHGESSASSGVYNFGVESYGALNINSANGAISLTGSSAASYGVEFSGVLASGTGLTLTSSKPSGIAISLTGTTIAASTYGLVFNNNSSKYIEATGGGAISINGTGTSGSYGLFLSGTNVLASTGAITLDGGTAGITFAGPSSTLGKLTSAGVGSSTSNITLTGGVVNVGVATTVDTSGTLTVQPSGNDFTTAFTMQNMTLGSTVSGLTLGKSATSADGTSDVAVTIGSATSVAGPINIYGSNINVNSGSTLTSTAGTQGILLKGSGSISQFANVQTSGGSVIEWADSNADSDGMIYVKSASITTSGGQLWMGGGSQAGSAWNGLTVGSGYAVGNATASNGITLDAATLNTNGGNMALYGKGRAGASSFGGSYTLSSNTNGIRLMNANTLNSGSGTIYMSGVAQGANSSNGIEFSQSGYSDVVTSANTTANAITLIGDASAAQAGATDAWGVYTWQGSIRATNGGGINITGNANKNSGVGIASGGSVQANAGTITLTGTGYGSTTPYAVNIAGTVGQGSAITSSTSDIVIVGNTLTASGGTVASSGKLTLQPYGNDFTSALSWPLTSLTLGSSISGLTLGKSATSADGTSDVAVTISSITSIAGPINIYSGNIILNAGLTTTNTTTGSVNLTASGGVSGGNGVSLAAGEALTITQAGNSTYDGVISGSGSSFTKAGVGTLTLRANQTYTGTTTLSAGTLQLGGGGGAGNLASSSVVDNANLVFDWNTGVTVASAISGSGNVSMIGGGIAYLTGNNTYGGTTTISSGTIQLGTGGTSGSLGSGPVVDNSVLSFDHSDSVTAANAISGSGQLYQLGSGTLILTGTNSYGSTTISAGTLQIGNGGTSGSVGSGTVTDNGNLTFDRSDVTTFANVINGSGSLTQLGSGTTVLSVANGYSGLTTVSAGTLGISNNNALGGTSNGVAVASGATLDLQAVTVGNKSVTLNGGSLATSVGTSSLSGNVTLGADSNVNVGGTQLTLSGIVSGTTYGVTTGGSGTLVFTGTNTYGGTTTIGAGTLQVGAGGTLGSLGSGGVVDNASLVFNRSDSLSVANDISGGGSLTQMGTGVLTVSGNNSFSGGVNLPAGSGSTLSLGSSGALGTAGSISFGSGILQYSASNTTDYSPRFSSAASQTYKIDTNSQNVTLASALGSTGGTLTKLGAGTLILTGTNNYSGITTVSSGVLQIGNGGTSGSLGTAGVTDNASLVFNRSDTVSVANAISGNGSVTQQSGTLTLTANGSYTGATTISSGALVLQNDAPATASSGFSGAGTLTIQSASASFGGGFNNSGWNFGSNLGGLTIGKTTNTQSVTLGSAVSIAGPIDIYGGALAVSHNLTSAATTGTGISLNGSSVTQDTGVAVATSGAIIEYLVSNAAWTAANDYGINLNGSSGSLATINANGGNIYLDASFAASGINNTAGSADRAIRDNYASITTTGSGTITLTGDATANASTTNTVWGIQLFNAAIQSASGAINVTGTGGKATSNSRGFAVDTSPASLLSASGSITISDLQASGLTGTYTGMYFKAPATSNIMIGTDGSAVASSSSNVSLIGDKISFNANGSYKPQINTSGDVIIRSNASGFASTIDASPLAIAGGPSSVSIGKTTNTADMTLGAITAAGPISTYGGNINLDANLTSTASGAAILLKGSGNIIQAASTSVTTNGGAITFWADSDANGGTIYLNDGTTLDSRTTSDRSASRTSTASGGGAITLGGGAGSTAPTGYAWQTSTNTSAGLTFGTYTGAGHNANVKLYSGGGDIAVRGKATAGANTLAIGIQSFEGLTVDAGTSGNIGFDGLATGNGTAAGMDLQAWRTGLAPSLLRTQNGSITLNGTASTGSAENVGINILANTGGALTIEATGAGGVSLSGSASGTSPTDIRLGNTNLLAASGPISIDGTGAGALVTFKQGSNYVNAIGYLAGSDVTASTSNVVITDDSVSLVASNGLQVNTAGTLTVQPQGNNFTGALDTTNLGLASTITGLTLGKDIGGTAHTDTITIGNAANIAGPINVFAGTIAINANLTAIGTNTISLTGTGNVTEGGSGYVSADKLALLGGNVALTNVNNAIGTLAASGVSGLTYTDSNGLTLGTVGASNGVSATGTVSIGTATGDLTLTQNVATTNATSSALVLNAGISAAAGTASGGNIALSGSPMVSVGTGGTAKLYSGSISGSTGLTALLGSGSGRFRYNSDESASHYATVLGTGLSAIYREQPTISTIAVNDQTITYGDAAPTWTFSIAGSQNGDTLAQAFSGGPSVTVGGSTSTSGNYTAGTSHTLTASGSLGTSLLGYANTASSYTAGALTVGQKTLSVGYTGVAKTYDGSISASVMTSDNRITNDVLTISSTAAFVDKNAASNVAVNVTGASLSNTDAANYALATTSGSATANITKATVGLSARKTYDGTTDLSGDVSITTGIGSETLTYTGATANDAHVATVGKYINALTLADQLGATTASGGLASNYQLPTLDAAHAPVTIDAKALTATASIGGTLSKTYSGTLSAPGATVSGTVTGAVSGDTISLDTNGVELHYNTAHVSTANSVFAYGGAGFNIDSSVSASQVSDYSFTEPVIADAAAHITPATLTLSLTNTIVSKTYDGTTNAPVGFTPAWSIVGFVAGDIAASVTNTGAAYNSKNVLGANKVTVSGASLSSIIGGRSSVKSDYALAATSVDTNASITPVTVSLSASKTYDGTTSLTGVVGITTGIAGETLTYTGATASDAHVVTLSKYINALTLADQLGATTASGGLASNYQLPTLNSTNAPVAISAAPLTASASIVGTLSKPYDGSTSANSSTASIGGSVAGAVSGDMLALDATGVSLAYDSAHVATASQIGVVSGTVGYSISGSVGSQTSDYNFVAPTISPVAAHITAATLTPTLTNTGVSKVYDGSADAPSGFAPTFSYGGLVSGDTAASLTYAGALYDNQNVINASKVTVSGLTIASISGSHQSASSDYVLDATTKDVAASITPKSVTVSGFTAANKTYDGTTNTSVTNWGNVSTGVGSETLTLNGTSANFSDPNANTGKTVTASYTLGSGSGLASNYQLSSSTATTTADISKALLTITANNDAKFITQADASGYNGVAYSGFVNGESNAVLSGSVAITRSNSSVNSAGSYNGVLVPDASGLTATNYSFQTQNGNYTVVGSNQLLVKVNNTSTTYGSAPNFTIADAEYYNGTSVVLLNSITNNGNGSFTVNDGAGGSATFTLTPVNATLSSAGKTTVGSYQLVASGVTTTNAQNFSNSLAVVGSETVAAKGVSASASSGVSKTYDGTTSMTGINIALTGLETNDVVTATGGGVFNTAHAGSNIGYTISNLALGSTDANNYYLSTGNALSGNDGTIYAKTLTGTASIGGTLSKNYDGSASASGANVSGSVGGAVAGDTLTLDTSGVSLAYNSAHVVGANSIQASGSAGFSIASSANGSLASDYSFSTPTIATATGASITPATLTLSLTNTGVTKTYDGTTAAPVGFTPVWSVVGFVTGDTAANVINTGAAYNSKNVLDANKVTVSGASLSSITGSRSSATSDYALAATSADVVATITPASVGLSASKTYDGTTDLTGAVSITTGVAGETLGYTGATANNAHVATAGKYINALTLVDQQAATSTSGGLASNYQLPPLDVANAPVAINARALIGSAAIGGTLSKSYDGTAMVSGASVSGTVTGAVSGDTISLDASGVTLNYNSAHVVGANSISASGSAGYTIGGTTHNSVTSDYSFSVPTIATATGASITPATLTLSLANAGVTKIYDGTISAPVGFTPAWNVVGFVTGDTVASVTNAGAAYNSKDVTTANKITVSGASLSDITGSLSSATSDYALAATSVDASAVITPKGVTVTGLTVANKTYDGTTNASVTNWGSVSTGVGSETLTLNGMGANFADPNASTGKTVTAAYTLANGGGNSAGLASNYLLSSNTATTTADINKALLIVSANNDAKFITQSDATGYNGVSYSGFVHGETSMVLGGSVAITRSNAGTDSAGTYNSVLVPDASGLSAANYNFQKQNGNYTVVGSNQLLVKVNNTNTTYGAAPSFTVADAAYYNGNAVVHLSSITSNGNGSFTINDGAGGSATFTLTPSNAILSSAGKTTVGSYQLDATGVTTSNAQNFNNALAVVGSETVVAKGVTASVSGGVSKTYDGTASMNGVPLALNTLETNDVVGVSRSGSFVSKNAGTGLVYTISDMALSGADAGNYYLTNANGFSGSDGVITPKAVTLTPQSGSKVYDGHASTGADLANLASLTSQLGITGDSVSAATLTYNDKNVDTGKTLSITSITLNDGNNGGNYQVSLASNHSSEITRLSSVSWVGGNTGNWFDPANWAGGAVPDLANVANVVIPGGVTVVFDTSGAVAPADVSSAVQIDSLRGNGGNLSQNNGTLNVGTGGIVLSALTQSGGTLANAGDTVLDSFAQTGGVTTLAQDLTVTQDFSQSGTGSVSVGGNTRITDTSGGAQLGNLSSTGTLSVTSTDGAIDQSAGTAITALSTSSFAATQGGTPADIALDNPGNDFQGAVSLNGRNLAIADANELNLGTVTSTSDFSIHSHGALDLGTTAVGRNLNADSGTGDITQYGPLNVKNATTLSAATGTITLTNPGNRLVNGVTVSASASHIVGDLVADARAAAGTATAGSGQDTSSTTAAAGSDPSAQKGPAPLTLGSMDGNSAGVSVDVQARPEAQATDMVAVSLPKNTATAGMGFSFVLPPSVTETASSQNAVIVTLPNGSPLPDWLQFNEQTMAFTASAVPDGSFPMRVLVTIGNKEVIVTIFERSE